MVQISVIIATRNRAKYLKEAIDSVLNQTLSTNEYEIIVVDNGSSDNTKEVVDNQKRIENKTIRYFYEERPGLHNGRHRGAKEARAELLSFADDDIIATPGWLKTVRDTFNHPNVALVGGKILPQWEGDMPGWVNLFKSETKYGWTIGYLSLLDFGDVTKEIPAKYVYGCNFSIRKSVLFECGGFHPDSMPQELIRHRGDGETGLSFAIEEKGFKSVYEPMASVYHRIPPERLTVDYFYRRAFNQGVSDSYTEIRRKRGLDNINPQPSCKAYLPWRVFKKLLRLLMFWKNKAVSEQHPVKRQVVNAYEEGRSYHRTQVEKDPELLEYVLKERYF